MPFSIGGLGVTDVRNLSAGVSVTVGAPPPPPPPSGEPGTVVVSATVYDVNGAALGGTRVLVWESDNPRVATVEALEHQRARVVARTPGTARITARIGALRSTPLLFTVLNPV